MHSHHSSFTFLKPCGLPLFSFSHRSLSPVPCGVLLSTPIFIKVSLEFQPGHLFFNSSCSAFPLVETATSVMDLLRTWWEARGTWHQVGWLCVYLLPGTIKSAVWRRVMTEWPCLWSKRVNGDGSTLLPSHPHSPYPDKGKPLTGSDGARHLWVLPLLCSFYSSLSLFLLSLADSLPSAP